MALASAAAPVPAIRARARPSVRAVLLGAIVLLALGLRLWGVGWQLPDPLYADELKYALAATLSADGVESGRADYRNPSLFRHALELQFRLGRLFGQPDLDELSDVDRELLAGRLLLGRLNAALLGTASVVLLYLAGRRLFGPSIGLLAATLLAVNFLHVHLSHYSLNDVPATFFMLASLLPAVGLIDQPSRRGFALAGLFGGLAAATKYNCGIVLVVPLAAWTLHAGRARLPPSALLDGFLLLGLGALGGFLLGMPEVLWSLDAVRYGVARQAELGDRRWSGQDPSPIPFLYLKTLAHAAGWPTLLAALAGLAVTVRRRRSVGLVLAACPLAYLGYMFGKELFFNRFALPVVPFVCLFAAYGLAQVSGQWAVGRGKKTQSTSHSPAHCPLPTAHSFVRGLVAAVACLAALGPPLLLDVHHDLLAGQLDTRVVARQWVLANLPRGARIAHQDYALPIILRGDDLARRYRFTSIRYLIEPGQFLRVACGGHQYVMLATFESDRQLAMTRPAGPTGFELLARHGRLLTTFWPGPNGTPVETNIDDDGLPFWHVARYARPGPTIYVFELLPNACPPRGG